MRVLRDYNSSSTWLASKPIFTKNNSGGSKERIIVEKLGLNIKSYTHALFCRNYYHDHTLI